jgi:hypothetical protein
MGLNPSDLPASSRFFRCRFNWFPSQWPLYAILAIFPVGGDEVHRQVDGHWVSLFPAAYLECLSGLASHELRMTVVEDMATEIYSRRPKGGLSGIV